MERLEYPRYGGPEVVHIAAFTLPPPGPQQLVVRVHAASINPMDWKIRSGAMRLFTGSRFPRAMGTDFAGTVVTVGTAVSRFRPGDEVLGTTSMRASGAFAPLVLADEPRLVRKPPGIDFAAAACLPIVGVTAWTALCTIGRVQRSGRVFIHGASGGVGSAATQIAQALGAEVAGSVGAHSMDRAREAGLQPVLDYSQPLPATLDGSFDVVFDCHGTLAARDARRLLRRGGRAIDIVPDGWKMLRSLTSSWYRVLVSDPTSERLQAVVDLAAGGALRLPIARVITLAEAPALLATLERGERLPGKAVIAFPAAAD